MPKLMPAVDLKEFAAWADCYFRRQTTPERAGYEVCRWNAVAAGCPCVVVLHRSLQPSMAYKGRLSIQGVIGVERMVALAGAVYRAYAADKEVS